MKIISYRVPSEALSNGKVVALQQHFLTHYRKNILNRLCCQNKPDNEFVVYAGTTGNGSIETINISEALIKPSEGGLHWIETRNIWIVKHFLFQPAMINVSLSRRYDCIIYLGSMYHLSTWVSALLAKLTGKRVLMWTHGYRKEERGIKGFLRAVFYKLADGLLLYGHRGRKFLIDRGFRSDSLYVVYNSLDYARQVAVRESKSLECLNEIRSKLFNHPDCPVIIFTGRLIARKGLDLLFNAQKMLFDRGVSVNVILIGDGPELNRLKRLVYDLGLVEFVVFYGACYNEDELGPMFMLSDLCVSPGEVGLTCIHAMAYGTPVITHDCLDEQGPESEAIVPGVTGDFFKNGDIASLVNVISKWLDRVDDFECTKTSCYAIIDKFYNLEYQQMVLNAAVSGISADTLINIA